MNQQDTITSGPMVQCTTQYGMPKSMYSIGYARLRQITTLANCMELYIWGKIARALWSFIIFSYYFLVTVLLQLQLLAVSQLQLQLQLTDAYFSVITITVTLTINCNYYYYTDSNLTQYYSILDSTVHSLQNVKLAQLTTQHRVEVCGTGLLISIPSHSNVPFSILVNKLHYGQNGKTEIQIANVDFTCWYVGLVRWSPCCCMCR